MKNNSSVPSKAKSIKIILLVFFLLFALSVMTFVSCGCKTCILTIRDFYQCVYMPDPDMAAIDYAEFPVVVTYEVDGEIITAHNTIICRYDGYRWDESDRIKHRKWAADYERGKRLVLHTTDDGDNIMLGVRCSPELLMGDIDEINSRSEQSSYYLGYTTGSSSSVFHDSDDLEILQKYGIRVLSCKIAPPVQNTFTPVTKYSDSAGNTFSITRTDDQGIKYRISLFSSKAVVVGYSGKNEQVTIPATAFGKTVSEIDDGAFADCDYIVRVIISDSVERIGTGIFFGCDSLVEVGFPDGVTSIPAETFAYCSSLTSAIPDGITEVGDSAFTNCDSLVSVDIPDSVERIGTGVFLGCDSLEKVDFPNGITTIPADTFAYCSSLTVAIPNGITEIGDHAFAHCYSLKSITLPNSVITIGSNAFERCHRLEHITLSDATVSIGKESFAWCVRISELFVPDSVISIGEKAFRGCYLALSLANSPSYYGYSPDEGIDVTTG